MKSAPPRARESTTRTASAESETATEISACTGLGPSTIGPGPMTRGTAMRPDFTESRAARRRSSVPPMSRMPVTPYATYAGRKLARASDDQSE